MMRAFWSVIWRELLRFWYQRERFFAALVRPLVWLFIFGAGFRAALGLSIVAPYETYIRYETYIIPGLCAMIILFNGMQSALSLVYDREMGSLRLLLCAPISRSWLLFSKLCASAFVSILQCYAFLLVAGIYGLIREEGGLILPKFGYLFVFPQFFVVAIMLGSFGLFISSMITRLQNFAGVMNFIIFPMFFMSTALYPLWQIQENAPLLAKFVSANPFTYAVELIRFGLYYKFDILSCIYVIGFALLSFVLAVWGYNNGQKCQQRRVK